MQHGIFRNMPGHFLVMAIRQFRRLPQQWFDGYAGVLQRQYQQPTDVQNSQNDLYSTRLDGI